jgi:hypothetical protein
VPRLLLSLTECLKRNQKRVGPLEKTMREKARWSDSVLLPILPPPQYRKRDWAVVGRAFDYWLRAFLVVRYNVCEGPTVVEMLLSSPRMAEYLATEIMRYGDGREVPLNEEFRGYVRVRREAIRSRNIEAESFFENCVEHGMAEGLYRNGEVSNLSCHPDFVIEDLRELARIASEKVELFVGTSLDVNPQFGHTVFAADGDFALGDRLVDVKTTQDLIPKLAFVQVLSYALIEAWDRGAALADLRYREVAIYAARYGALGVVELRDVGPVLAELRAFLEEAAHRQEAQYNLPARSVWPVLEDVLMGRG